MLMVTTDEVWFRYLDYSGQTKAVRVASVRFWPDIQETIFPPLLVPEGKRRVVRCRCGVMTGMRMAAGWVNTAAPAAGNTYRYLRKRTDIWLSTSKKRMRRYGREVYRAFRSKGNHRWDTCVFVNESGAYSAVFRHSFRKKVIEDGKRSGATSLMMKSWWPRRTRAVLPGQNSHNWPTQRS
ncbi:hypothetical protein [Klebsiella pneumoniae]|uniref:hypothetical protein n=1 Tax=Klebsiella pneumoniae TaxID=573 RepID=UPI00388F118B